MRCPECRSRQVGLLSATQFYCWECCVEFAVTDGRVEVYAVELDGTLIAREAAGGMVETALASGSQ